MENEQQSAKLISPERKIYEEYNILVASLLGGPLTGAYIIANNFKCFDDRKKVKQAWIYAIGFLLLFLINWLFVDMYKLYKAPSTLMMSLTYGIFAYPYVNYHQRKQINRHLEKGGGYFGWGRTILVILIGWIFTALILLLSASFVLLILSTLGFIQLDWTH